MESSPALAAQEYTLTLAELKSNNKTQINLLTILAEDYKQAAEQIVDAIEAHMLTVPPTQKLTVMYVCDSILKNVKKPNDYDVLFARKMVNMFEHCFRQGDEKVRSALYKLRVTWATTSIFAPSKLYAIDMKINALDSAWPISNPRTGRALRDDPTVAPPTPTSSTPAPSSRNTPSSSSSTSSTTPRVFVNRKFIDATPPPKPAASTAKKVEKVEKTKTPPTSSSSNSASSAPQKPIKKEPKQQNVDPLDKLLPTSTSSSSAKSSTTPAKRKAAPAEHSNAPNRKKSQGPPTPTNQKASASKTPKDEDLRTISSSTRGSRNQNQNQTGGSRGSQQDQDLRGRPLKPTLVAGSHAFAPRPMITSMPPGPPPMHHGPPPPFVHHHNSPPQDPAPLMMSQGPPPPTQYHAQPPPPPRGMMNGGPPGPLPMIQQQVPIGNNAPAVAPTQSKHVYASEATKLDVPANNRIFVEGKAYEVMFVDDTAVIERGGAPHRIYFAGNARNLIIDGIPHMLEFDTPTLLDIHGTKHMVKFGAPSRELYIGGHPFKGQFGGPPIVATINGRRHEIRLTGSAPEVRIEPEPAYHLTRFLHKMREEKKIEITAEKPKDTGDWLAYLKNLQKTGVLPPVKSASPRQTPPPTGPMQQQRGGPRQPNIRGNRPPINQWGGKPTMMPEHQVPATQSSSGVEKRHVPPAAITDFNIRLLQIRYDTVVEMLITKRADACKFCGMRLDDSNGKSKEWQDHMDWHVKQNLARGTTSDQATFRMWYPTAANWLTARASEQPKKVEEPEGPVPGVASSGVKAKECAVCREKFDEYFDHDEECWRLRDTVSAHGKIVHSYCADDAHLLDVTPSTSYHENPFFHVKEELMETDEDLKQDVKNIIASFEQKNALSSR